MVLLMAASSSFPVTHFSRPATTSSSFNGGNGLSLFPNPPTPSCKAMEEERGGPMKQNMGMKGLVSEMVGKRVEELLKSEENVELMEKLGRAEKRVEDAKMELANIERMEREAALKKEYVKKLEARASEIDECQEEISAARNMLEEAERSLTAGIDSNNLSPTDKALVINQDAERRESARTAVAAALVGTLASFPLSILHANNIELLLLRSAITFISCALFGVTFRYAIRRDLDNFQLKTGVCAAFGFVKGLAESEGSLPVEFTQDEILQFFMTVASCVSENVFVFLFAAVGVDLGFKLRLLSPFPTMNPPSESSSRR